MRLEFGKVVTAVCVTLVSLACSDGAGGASNADPSGYGTSASGAGTAVGAGTAGAATGAATGAAGGRAARPPASRGTVLFIGTSLTAGLGLNPEQAYPALIQERIDSAGLGYRVVNAGLSGETSAGALRRLDWLLQQPVEVVVLETGANDGLRGLNVDSTQANIQTTVERIRRTHPDAAVFLVQMEAPTNLGPRYTTAFRGMFPAVAAATGATLIPFLLDGVAGVRSLNQSDGIHPNAEGARVMADTMWGSLRPVLLPGGER